MILNKQLKSYKILLKFYTNPKISMSTSVHQKCTFCLCKTKIQQNYRFANKNLPQNVNCNFGVLHTPMAMFLNKRQFEKVKTNLVVLNKNIQVKNVNLNKLRSLEPKNYELKFTTSNQIKIKPDSIHLVLVNYQQKFKKLTTFSFHSKLNYYPILTQRISILEKKRLVSNFILNFLINEFINQFKNTNLSFQFLKSPNSRAFEKGESTKSEILSKNGRFSTKKENNTQNRIAKDSKTLKYDIKNEQHSFLFQKLNINSFFLFDSNSFLFFVTNTTKNFLFMENGVFNSKQSVGEKNVKIVAKGLFRKPKLSLIFSFKKKNKQKTNSIFKIIKTNYFVFNLLIDEVPYFINWLMIQNYLSLMQFQIFKSQKTNRDTEILKHQNLFSKSSSTKILVFYALLFFLSNNKQISSNFKNKFYSQFQQAKEKIASKIQWILFKENHSSVQSTAVMQGCKAHHQSKNFFGFEKVFWIPIERRLTTKINKKMITNLQPYKFVWLLFVRNFMFLEKKLFLMFFIFKKNVHQSPLVHKKKKKTFFLTKKDKFLNQKKRLNLVRTNHTNNPKIFLNSNKYLIEQTELYKKNNSLEHSFENEKKNWQFEFLTFKQTLKSIFFLLLLLPEWELKWSFNCSKSRPGRSFYHCLKQMNDSLYQETQYVFHSYLSNFSETLISLSIDKTICHFFFVEKWHNKTAKNSKTGIKIFNFETNAWLKVYNPVILNHTGSNEPFPFHLNQKKETSFYWNVLMDGLELEFFDFILKQIYILKISNHFFPLTNFSFIQYGQNILFLYPNLFIFKKALNFYKKWCENTGIELKLDQVKISHSYSKKNRLHPGFLFDGFFIIQSKLTDQNVLKTKKINIDSFDSKKTMNIKSSHRNNAFFAYQWVEFQKLLELLVCKPHTEKCQYLNQKKDWKIHSNDFYGKRIIHLIEAGTNFDSLKLKSQKTLLNPFKLFLPKNLLFLKTIFFRKTNFQKKMGNLKLQRISQEFILDMQLQTDLLTKKKTEEGMSWQFQTPKMTARFVLIRYPHLSSFSHFKNSSFFSKINNNYYNKYFSLTRNINSNLIAVNNKFVAVLNDTKMNSFSIRKLNFNIRMFWWDKMTTSKPKNYYILCMPSKFSVREHLKQLKRMIKNSKALTQHSLIQQLTPKIKSWCSYYQYISNKQIFSYCDFMLFKFLWKWACQRHPNKSKKWIKAKYFHSMKEKSWLFGFYNKTQHRYLFLTYHREQKLLKYTKIQEHESLYNDNWNF